MSVRGKFGQSRVRVKCLSRNDAPLPKRASERLPVGGYLEAGDGAEISNQKSKSTSPSACLMGITSSFTWPRWCFLHPPLPARCSPGPQPLRGGRGGESPPVAKVPSVFSGHRPWCESLPHGPEGLSSPPAAGRAHGEAGERNSSFFSSRRRRRGDQRSWPES